MSASEAGPVRGPLVGSVRAAYAAGVLLFGWAIAQFYAPGTGFTSLIMIGDAIEAREVTQLRHVPHFVYEDSAGYDGAYYVQLALNPTLQNPELATAIDNLPYRARRILSCWVAWLAGLGRPGWIVQAHALLNVATWLGLAWVLLRWFPATSWENFFRWSGVMFSHGLIMSVRDSLVDGPALLLVALALAAWEDGRQRRAAALLALAGLTRETSLLAATGLAPADARDRAGWRRFAHLAFVAALPLLVWVIYLRWKFGAPSETGLNNFTLPLAGFIEKWRATFTNFRAPADAAWSWATLAAMIGLTVQAVFFATRWRPRELAWRVGATFVALMLFLATPVWEGFPGAAGRALLPMTLAFNLLVPRGGRWWAVLLAGNLTIVAAFMEFTPPREFFSVTAPRELLSAVTVKRTGGWYGAESSEGLSWRWSSGQSGLRVRNDSGAPLVIACQGRAASAADRRRLRISANAAMVWSGDLTAGQTVNFQFGVTLPAGETELTFVTDQPAHPIGADPRMMAFEIFNLTLAVKPAPGPR